MIRSCCTTN